MFSFGEFFEGQVQALRREQRYRRFRTLGRRPGEFPRARLAEPDRPPRDVVVWCSNDYLGMSQHPTVLAAGHEALGRYGAGAGGTRNISGTHELIVALESELANLHRKSGALVFSSGYVANDTTLATLGRNLPGCTFFSDASNHASMIEGIRRSGAGCEVFAHNDPDSLHRLLARSRPGTPRVVAFESLYSMDGDIAPIPALVATARHHGALVFVDETHAVGVHGPEGAGLVAQAGLLDQVDIVQGGLGKGYGAVGGFVTANATLIDFLRSYAPGFIFTTALPPAVAASALASVRHLRHSGQERHTLLERVARVRRGLELAGLPLMKSESQILPLIIGDSSVCERVADRLIDVHGVYLQPINYPTVPRGSERFRITPTALHTDSMAEALLVALRAELRRKDIVRAA